MKKTLMKVLSTTAALALVLASTATALVPAEADVKAAEKSIVKEAIAAEANFVPEIGQHPSPLVDPDYTYVEDEDGDKPVLDLYENEPEAGAPEETAPAPEAPADDIETIYAEDVTIVLNKTTREVEITGEGAIPADFYSLFMSKASAEAALTAALEAEYGEVELVYNGTDDAMDFMANNEYYSVETGERLFVTEEMFENIDFEDFLYFSPVAVTIDEGITDIPDYAFAFWAELESVTLPSTVRHIGEAAFAYCTGLEGIIVPAAVESIYLGTFDGCTGLIAIQLTEYDNGDEALFYGTDAHVVTVYAADADELPHCNFIA